MNQQLLFDLLNRALTEEMGLVVETQNPRALSHNLLAITKGNDRYRSLQITIPSTPNTLIIAKPAAISLDESVYPVETNDE